MDTLKFIAVIQLFSIVSAALVWDPSIPTPLYEDESAEIGKLLLTLSVNRTGTGTGSVTILRENEETLSLCNITETTTTDNTVFEANVTLASELDCDFNAATRNLLFLAREEGPTSQISKPILLTIFDINDNKPRFRNLPYECSPSEDTENGTEIFSDIDVWDPDPTSVFSDISIISDPATDGMFRLESTAFENTANARIILTDLLDYERKHSYTITIVATDNGGLNETTTVTVSVIDVQDTPPFFLFDVYRGALAENKPPGTSAIQVQAEDGDGDRNSKNEITYSIIEGGGGLFLVDNTTGLVSSVVTIDREDPAVVDVNGVFQLTVQAEELNGSLPQFGNTTATVAVFITIEDENDNSPTFNTTAPYTAFVRSDIPDNSLIYFGGDGYMRVYDNDQTGKSATFSLRVETDADLQGVFLASPAEVFSEANVLIRVVNASAIRTRGGTHITLRVVAREIDTVESFEGSATVVLSVEATEEPTTTPEPVQEELFKAPDIVVFVVGFLVLLNITTSIVICYMLRGRRSRNKEGLSRHGSKYYIKKRSNDFTNHGMHNPSTTEMIEVDPEVAVCPRDPGRGLAFNTRGWRDMLTSPRM